MKETTLTKPTSLSFNEPVRFTSNEEYFNLANRDDLNVVNFAKQGALPIKSIVAAFATFYGLVIPSTTYDVSVINDFPSEYYEHISNIRDSIYSNYDHVRTTVLTGVSPTMENQKPIIKSEGISASVEYRGRLPIRQESAEYTNNERETLLRAKEHLVVSVEYRGRLPLRRERV